MVTGEGEILRSSGQTGPKVSSVPLDWTISVPKHFSLLFIIMHYQKQSVFNKWRMTFFNVIVLHFGHILSLNFTTLQGRYLYFHFTNDETVAQRGHAICPKPPWKERIETDFEASVYCPDHAARKPRHPFQTSFSWIICFCFLSWLKLNRYVLIIITKEARNCKFLKLHQPARSLLNRRRGRYLANQWAADTVRISRAVT